MPLYMEYNIIQMSAAASRGGTGPSDPIFNNFAPYPAEFERWYWLS